MRDHRNHSTAWLNPGKAFTRAMGIHGREVRLDGDVNVAVAAGVALTQPWWQEWFTFVPGILQFVVLLFTVLYVIFRALNEIRSYTGAGKDRQ